MERILLVEGDPLEARALSSSLAGDYLVRYCPDPRGASDEARRFAPAAVILGLPPAFGPIEALIRELKGGAGGAPLLVAMGDVDAGTAASCLRAGVAAILPKPWEPAGLRRSLASAIAGSPGAARGGSPFIGTSRAIRKVEAELRLFADSECSVLVLGESGTGKEVAAQALRDLSPRRSGPFVVLNCAAIPELLAESELFGTERGAFTDAISRPGAFELARGGLLFLDEIGDAPPAIQAKLLRVLETRQFTRLGARGISEADFRFVSATSRDLESEAAAGRFRPDLLYRIDTLFLEMPPLRERREDIPDLAEHFACVESRGRVSLTPEALDKLAGFSWPGNVRQLRNIVRRAIVLARGADAILAEQVILR